MYRDTFVEINLDNLALNTTNIVKTYNEYKYYIAMVKSNCYGHGSYIVKTLLNSGINYLAVSNLSEAINLRKYEKDVPILCVEPIPMKYVVKASELNITFTVSNLEYLHSLIKVLDKKNLLIHLKVNSGMNRLGFNNEEEFLEAYKLVNKYYTLEGVFSHFHTTGLRDINHLNQINEFKKITGKINLNKIKMVHFSKSSTLVNHDKMDFCNSIRIGALLYGIDVSLNKDSSYIKSIIDNTYKKIKKIPFINYGCKIKPITSLSLYSNIIDIQKVKSGSYIGYDFNYKVSKESIIGVISIGYSDGLHPKDTNREVYINNKPYKIVGRVNSNMTLILIDETVSLSDKVMLYGPNIPMNNIAASCDSTVYNLLGFLHETLPRIYIKDKKIVHTEIWKLK